MASIRIISTDGEVVKVDGYAGCSFGNITKEAIELAADLNKEVAYEFNGVPCVVTATSDPDAIWKYINDTWERERAEYEASQEYKDNQLKAYAASERRALRMKQILAEFPQIVEANVLLDNLYWLKAFTELADYNDMTYDRAGIVAGLSLMGYVENDLVGAASTMFSDPVNVARWIFGQVIEMMRSGMPPHPGMISHMERCIESLEELATTA